MKKSAAYLPSSSHAETGNSPRFLRKINALVKQSRFHEALSLIETAAGDERNNAEVLYTAGMCANLIDEFSKAEGYWRQALQLKADFHTVYSDLGVVLERQYRYEEAEASYRKAIAIMPSYAEAHSNLGDLLEKQQRNGEAEACYRMALEHQPNLSDVHRNLANLLLSLKRHAEAERSYRQAIILAPSNYAAHLGLANVLVDLRRYNDAEASFRQALKLQPNALDAHYDLTLLLFHSKRFAEAEAELRKTVLINPNYAEAQQWLGYLLLIQGRFAEGWKLHEYRYHWAAKSQPALACFQLEFPQWQGQSLQGKSIVIFPEQGRGDQIQFCRYGTELKRLGAKRVTLICQAPLITLLKSLADVDSVLNINEISKLKNHDYWTLLFSMPLHCGTDLTNIPAALPYLYADKQRLTKWSKQMPKSGLRVGLVWKGNPDHKNDANRSLPSLLSLARLWQITDLVFISLQKGPAEEKALSKPPRQKNYHA